MIKYFSNNIEIKKILKDRLKYIKDYKIKICCCSGEDEDVTSTDLLVEIYKDDKYIDSVTYSTIEKNDISYEEWWDEIEKHRKDLKETKSKLHKYLTKHFSNVVISKDYTV